MAPTSTATPIAPVRIFTQGKPGLEGTPIQFGRATLATWIIVSMTMIPEMMGARKKRANKPIKLNRRMGTLNAHQISEATKKDP